MNKNLFIYSFKYLAVLLALVTFSSCERDEFTQKDAFDLQQAQLDAQYTRDTTALGVQDTRIKQMAIFRAEMERLARLNSGGKVFYTVNVVPGGSSAFSSGRFEEVEGITGARVTVSQFGEAVVSTKDTENGLAVFELYSGEVTVNIEADNHTDVNYTANLTPDGGVPNGAAMYVGNVIPVFDDPNNPYDLTDAEFRFATVSGLAFAELDIYGDNNQEESVPDGTKVRAFIDVANPAFKTKYINQANDEGVNIGGVPTKSGYIQRFAYEEAASTTGITETKALGNDTAPEGGEYSISIGATASGLPITMKFDDFAADRTYYFFDNDGDLGGPNGVFGGPGAKRFIYTQNTQNVENTATGGTGANQSPSEIGLVGSVVNGGLSSTVDLFSASLRVAFSLSKTTATATAALTGGDAVSTVTITDGGYYYVAPTVTFSAAPTGGTTATGTANLVDLPAAVVGEPATLTAARARGMKTVGSVTVSGGSGYTANPTVTFTRFSYTGRTAAVAPATVGAPVANGTGSVAAASSTIKYIRIINGGFGMNNPSSTGVGEYTGTVPGVVFNNNVIPAGGTLATANLIVDNIVGTATEVQIVGGGNGYSDANLAITFNYGRNGVVGVNGASLTPALFTSVGGELRWNIAAPSRNLTGTSGEVTFNNGTNYSFVPSVSLTGLTAAGTGTLPTFAATVVGGIITQIEIQGATSGWPAGEYTGTINISANPDNVAISAEGFTEGGSIDTYTFTGNYGTPVGIYKSSVEAAGATFNYITANAAGDILANNAGAALTTNAQFSTASDFVFVFENPTTGTSNAWGFPIFDNGGNNVVGLLFAQGTGQGIGYTTIPAGGFKFWVLPNEIAGTPNAHLAKYAQSDANPLTDANASATAARSAQNLTITFTNGGLGYAIRPEFIIAGGQRSAEDLATLNSSVNGVRGQLNFNSLGTITNTSVTTAIAAGTFTAAGLAAEPLTVIVSMDRLQGLFNREANFRTSGANTTPFSGGLIPTTDGDTDINSPAVWTYATAKTAANAVAGTTTPLNMFNSMEGSAEFTAADRVGTNGAANANFKYITAPTYTINMQGFDTGGNGVAILDPNTADITSLSATANGTFPTNLNVSSFSIVANNAGTAGDLFIGQNLAGVPTVFGTGERFRTVGGPSNFEVFSGLTYIRDVNYGTGIELE